MCKDCNKASDDFPKEMYTNPFYSENLAAKKAAIEMKKLSEGPGRLTETTKTQAPIAEELANLDWWLNELSDNVDRLNAKIQPIMRDGMPREAIADDYKGQSEIVNQISGYVRRVKSITSNVQDLADRVEL